ncbi:MAG TPA: DUF4124 domain-containing protein [Burkholderiales bacterium]|nr:DUF4124 domain-containing protein [Burkholderiales bacterium]
MRRPDTHARLLAIVLAGCAACFVCGAGAQTYKWTDAEGKVHYSDQPPPGNAKQETTISPRRKPSASAPAASKPKTYREQEAEFRQRQVEAAEKDAAAKKKADEAAEKKRNCEQARNQVATLQAGGRIARTSENGEREYLSDAQIAEEIERGKKSIDAWCK